MRTFAITILLSVTLLAAGCLGEREAQEEQESQTPGFIETDPCSLYEITLHWQDDPNVERIVAALEAEEYVVTRNSEENYTIEPVYGGVIGYLYVSAEDAGAGAQTSAEQGAANATEATANATGVRNLIIQLRETGESESHRSLVLAAADDIAPIVTEAMDGQKLVDRNEAVIETC